MTNISLLLAALLLAALQQQLLVVDGGAFHKEVHRKHSAAHQHRHQHFVSDTKTNQQQQQHHHRSHSRQQQHQQQQSAAWQQQHKIKNVMSTEPTTITTTTTSMHRNPHLQHHQRQQQQQTQEQTSSKLYADVDHTYATHTFAKVQRKLPLLTSTEASTLSEVSASFSPKAASAASSSSTSKSSQQLADANRAQNYKSSVPSHSVVVDDRFRLKSMESLDYADDYYYDDDDSEDNNDVDDGDENKHNNNNDNASNDSDDDVVYTENYDSDIADQHHILSSSSSSARVVRAQHHLPHSLTASGIIRSSKTASRLDHQASKPSLTTLLSSEPSQYLDHDQQLLASDQDYADDEPYRSSAENHLGEGPGVLTEQKFRELGTLEAVQQTRDRILQEQEHMRQKTPAELAREHMDRMKTAGRCSRPLPRVIHVSNETSKRYVPYCTILHRCGEDTGCCDSTRQVCAAKSFEDVPVYFFVIKVNSRSNKRDTEVLMLRNHTECHCVNRSNLTASLQYMPRDKRSDFSRRRYHQQSQQLRQYQDASWAEQLDEMSNMICRCPKHFDIFPEHAQQHVDSRHSSDTTQATLRCRCDCLSHNLPCRRLQHGEEGFAVDERKCIAERICKAPVCLHGDYSHQTGRCPRRKNHKRTVTRYDYGYG